MQGKVYCNKSMPRRNDHYHQYYYYQPCWIDWIIVSLMLGIVAIFAISYFIFSSDEKARSANAEATKNYEKIISIAAGNCDLKVVKFLIERNLLDIHSTRGSGGWLLGYATEKECLEVVQFLAEQKVDINSTSGNLSNITALHYAAKQGNLEIVKVLLQNGANPNAKEFRGRKPRDLAAIQYSGNSNKPYKEIISLLYEAERTYISEK